MLSVQYAGNPALAVNQMWYGCDAEEVQDLVTLAMENRIPLDCNLNLREFARENDMPWPGSDDEGEAPAAPTGRKRPRPAAKPQRRTGREAEAEGGEPPQRSRRKKQASRQRGAVEYKAVDEEEGVEKGGEGEEEEEEEAWQAGSDAAPSDAAAKKTAARGGGEGGAKAAASTPGASLAPIFLLPRTQGGAGGMWCYVAYFSGQRPHPPPPSSLQASVPGRRDRLGGRQLRRRTRLVVPLTARAAARRSILWRRRVASPLFPASPTACKGR